MINASSGQQALWPRADIVTEARDILGEAIDRIKHAGFEVAGIVGMFSGGKDSSTVGHLFREQVTHFGHCNTSVGIEQTRQFVRDTCNRWDVPLLEQHIPEGRRYEDYVLGRVISSRGPNKGKRAVWPGGFPGPAVHDWVYQWLKGRSAERLRNQLITDPRRQRVIFLSGIRTAESARRRTGTARGRYAKEKGSIVWVQPIRDWTALDLNAYRRANPDFPVNEVSDLLHISGECCCGANAKKQEVVQIEMFFPSLFRWLQDLGLKARKAGVAPPQQCVWGWGWGRQAPSRAGGPLCAGCDTLFDLPAGAE